MIRGYDPILQALMGTLLTWGLTAAGAGLVFFMKGTKRKVLDASLGFAGGVMTAASFWSLLAPAIEMAQKSRMYGVYGEYAIFPVAGGFLLGGAFVFLADHFMDDANPTSLLLAKRQDSHNDFGSVKKDDDYRPAYSAPAGGGGGHLRRSAGFTSLALGDLKQRSHTAAPVNYSPVNLEQSEEGGVDASENAAFTHQQWKRILLLIVAITVHNIPEGLAVGVAFGAVHKTRLATFNRAKNLAIGIGIQNFPEGLAVSLPLRAAGYSKWTAFWYGQLSGMVEPVAGLLGAALVSLCEPLLPWGLAFAAGAMICVVVDDIIPEAHSRGNGRLSSYWCLIGFVVMMTLDVSLG